MRDLFERVRPFLHWFFNNPRAEFFFYIFFICLSLFFLRGFLFSAGFGLSKLIYFVPVVGFAVYLVFWRK